MGERRREINNAYADMVDNQSGSNAFSGTPPPSENFNIVKEYYLSYANKAGTNFAPVMDEKIKEAYKSLTKAEKIAIGFGDTEISMLDKALGVK